MVKLKYDKFNIRVYSAIPEDSVILDVGCATGKLGKHLRKGKSPEKLIGIEVDKVAAKKAKEFYDNVITYDLEKITKLPFEKKYFDCIVLADVLEHLKRPDNLLKILSQYLSDDGVLVVSVPNVAFISIRISLVVGRFEYQEKGILDKSHLHFFTLSTIKKLIRDSGYQVVSARGYINTRPVLRFLDILATLFPSIFAYQLLLVARKDEAPPR